MARSRDRPKNVVNWTPAAGCPIDLRLCLSTATDAVTPADTDSGIYSPQGVLHVPLLAPAPPPDRRTTLTRFVSPSVADVVPPVACEDRPLHHQTPDRVNRQHTVHTEATPDRERPFHSTDRNQIVPRAGWAYGRRARPRPP